MQSWAFSGPQWGSLDQSQHEICVICSCSPKLLFVYVHCLFYPMISWKILNVCTSSLFPRWFLLSNTLLFCLNMSSAGFFSNSQGYLHLPSKGFSRCILLLLLPVPRLYQLWVVMVLPPYRSPPSSVRCSRHSCRR